MTATKRAKYSSRPPLKGLFRHVRLLLSLLGLLYGMVVLAIMTPVIQTHVVYANRIDTVGFTRFDTPEAYGLAPGKTVNLELRGSDNTTIGAWYMFSQSFYRNMPFPPPLNQSGAYLAQQIRKSTTRRPTVLFLHGNTGTRAIRVRVNVYGGLTSRLDANVLAIDYRGFGDSAGRPTVEGVARDAKAAWDFLIERAGAAPEDILIVGHSLGTAVAGLLSAQLGKEGVTPRGVVMLAPFSSIRLVMDQYHIFGLFPLLAPAAKIPVLSRGLKRAIAHKFDTLSLVPDIKASVLIAHALNDPAIPHQHGSIIFNALLDPYIPGSPHPDLHHPLTLSESEWHVITAQQAIRSDERSRILNRTHILGFGTMDTFQTGSRSISLLKVLDGAHDIGRMEGVQDVIGRMFGLVQ